MQWWSCGSIRGDVCLFYTPFYFSIYDIPADLNQIHSFSKDDIIVILTRMISFEEGSLIKSIVNEIYRKTGTTVSAISIIAALWSSSRGVYSIVIGLNSVYDIDENRNYFAIRLFSLVYTLLFALMISVMLVMWVFGNSLYSYFLQNFLCSSDTWIFYA